MLSAKCFKFLRQSDIIASAKEGPKLSNAILSDPKLKAIEDCLVWLVPLFQIHGVPYQIVGGLAAKFHGAKRALVDIDFYADMRAAGFPAVLTDIKEYLSWGPEHFKDQSWDITFLKIDFGLQRIEIGDSNDAYFFDRVGGQWIKQEIDYAGSVDFKVFGLTVQVMPKQALISYKRMLGREVDLADLADLDSDIPSERSQA